MSDVQITVDGRSLRAEAGSTVAAALASAEILAFGVSPKGRARGPLCGMGTCHECRVTIDGVMHQRACMRVVEPGMVVATHA